MGMGMQQAESQKSCVFIFPVSWYNGVVILAHVGALYWIRTEVKQHQEIGARKGPCWVSQFG